jgi:hypothetical protein
VTGPRTQRILSLPKLAPVDQPASITPLIPAAIKAMHRGEATPHQQQKLLEWIIQEASGTGPSYRPNDPQATAFGEGRRFVGFQLLHWLTTEVKSGN